MSYYRFCIAINLCNLYYSSSKLVQQVVFHSLWTGFAGLINGDGQLKNHSSVKCCPVHIVCFGFGPLNRYNEDC